jgi:WXXGXW repeat (2 copies)
MAEGGLAVRNFFNLRNLSFFVLLCIVPTVMPVPSFAQVAVSITVGPPAIPVYEQPPCPEDGYLWEPGYWAYGPGGYYWVPGEWVEPPHPGLLWTPGYWAFDDDRYFWHRGYWGPHVGFYGGINYGFGFFGVGFVGGEWRGERFAYNTAVVNVNRTVVRNVYVNKTVINNTTIVNNHYSFNGRGGVNARPTGEEQRWSREQHFQPTAGQMSHQRAARVDRSNYVAVNHGTPAHPEGMGVNARQDRQQNRINQGAQSGQLTRGETAHIERNETAIHNEVHNDRAANGGHLTPQEHRQVEHQQNQESRQIYRDKHNEKTQSNPQGEKGERGEHGDHERK